jgi:phosphatidylinositol alpha-1,6-mannosyltransferase
MMTMMVLQFLHAFRPAPPPAHVSRFRDPEVSRNPLTRRWLAGRLIPPRRPRQHPDQLHPGACSASIFPEAAAKDLLTPGALRSDFAVHPETDPDRPATGGHPHGRPAAPAQGPARDPAGPPDAPGRRPRANRILGGRGQSKGNYERVLEAAAALPDLPVRFLRQSGRRELDAGYAEADIFAMTSVSHKLSIEGFGLVYLEAAAHGLPVVAHASVASAEAVVDGVTGLLVPPGILPPCRRLSRETDQRFRLAPLQLGGAGRAWARRHCWQDPPRQLFDLPAPAIKP